MFTTIIWRETKYWGIIGALIFLGSMIDMIFTYDKNMQLDV